MKGREGPAWTGSAGFLTFSFACFKLGHFTDWSWWWVFSPLLGCAAVVAFCVVMIAVTLTRTALRQRER